MDSSFIISITILVAGGVFISCLVCLPNSVMNAVGMTTTSDDALQKEYYPRENADDEKESDEVDDEEEDDIDDELHSQNTISQDIGQSMEDDSLGDLFSEDFQDDDILDNDDEEFYHLDKLIDEYFFPKSVPNDDDYDDDDNLDLGYDRMSPMSSEVDQSQAEDNHEAANNSDF